MLVLKKVDTSVSSGKERPQSSIGRKKFDPLELNEEDFEEDAVEDITDADITVLSKGKSVNNSTFY